MGKYIVAFGIAIVVIGLVILLLEKFTGRPGGLLPGDVFIRRGNFTFYFPIVTSIIVSIVLTIILQLIFSSRR